MNNVIRLAVIGALTLLSPTAFATVITGDIDSAFGEHGYSLLHGTDGSELAIGADHEENPATHDLDAITDLSAWHSSPDGISAIYEARGPRGRFGEELTYALYGLHGSHSGGANAAVSLNGHVVLEEGRGHPVRPYGPSAYQGVMLTNVRGDDRLYPAYVGPDGEVLRRSQTPIIDSEDSGAGATFQDGMIVFTLTGPFEPSEDGDIFNGYGSFYVQVYTPDLVEISSFLVAEDRRHLHSGRALIVDNKRIVVSFINAEDKSNASDGDLQIVAFTHAGEVDTSWGEAGYFSPPPPVSEFHGPSTARHDRRIIARPGGGLFYMIEEQESLGTGRLFAYDSLGQLDVSFGDQGEMVTDAPLPFQHAAVFADNSILWQAPDGFYKSMPNGRGLDANFKGDGFMDVHVEDGENDASGQSRGRVCKVSVVNAVIMQRMDHQGRVLRFFAGSAPETERPSGTRESGLCILRYDPEIDMEPDRGMLTPAPGIGPAFSAVQSEALTVQGLGQDVRLIAAVLNGTMSVNGGEDSGVSAWVGNGDTITLTATAPGTPGEEAATTLVLSDSIAAGFGREHFSAHLISSSGHGRMFEFTVAANRGDGTPDAFAFDPVTDAELGSEYTSNQISISGIDVDVPVSIAGEGQYRVNGGSFGTAPAMLSEGDTITLRILSADEHEQARSSTLTVGNSSATFTVTTAPETVDEPGSGSDTGGDTGGGSTGSGGSGGDTGGGQGGSSNGGEGGSGGMPVLTLLFMLLASRLNRCFGRFKRH
ncbi:hypothetical protein [uncultured Abyssibacter sp.]|uniref:hypothetical protein n=1 Tax=uncultured Abyssibacter sp. TaxID=2320202 RepID=UPI0032B1E691